MTKRIKEEQETAKTRKRNLNSLDFPLFHFELSRARTNTHIFNTFDI